MKIILLMLVTMLLVGCEQQERDMILHFDDAGSYEQFVSEEDYLEKFPFSQAVLTRMTPWDASRVADSCVNDRGDKSSWELSEPEALPYLEGNNSGGEGVEVAVMDIGFCEARMDYSDFYDESAGGQAIGCGHGNKVSSVLREVAPDTDIIGISVGCYEYRYSDFLRGVERVREIEPDVLTISLNIQAEQASCVLDRLVEETGIYVFVSAGNDIPNKLANGEKVYSITGENKNRDYVGEGDYVAPTGFRMDSSSIHGYSKEFCGTSFAAPQVAGKTAILLGNGEPVELGRYFEEG